jgi:penicillin-binding protein 1A
MIDDDHIPRASVELAPPPVSFEPPLGAPSAIPGGRPRRLLRRPHRPRLPPTRRPRLRKLRLIAIVLGLGILAVVSAVFGMMMAITSDLPQLENYREFHADLHNSYLYDDQGRPIGVLAAPAGRFPVIDTFAQISPYMRRAIVAVEDKRFWHESGVDLRGLLRAGLNDLTGGDTQGGSTIAEQFVKNVLKEEDNRTIFEKLREAVLAFQLTHRWSHGKILREYLNSIYFGEGAYGIETAARVYFGQQLGYVQNATSTTPASACGDANAADPKLPECASKLNPAQAALLAGMVANPSAFNPLVDPGAARSRRDLVLQDMRAQRYITTAQYERYRNAPLPTQAEIEQPQQPSAAPYFTSWVEPQIIGALERAGVSPKVAEYRAFWGGLKIHTTIDLPMQQAAQQAVDSIMPQGPNEPTAALVAIDNRTGEVRAMVSGNGDYAKSPFNLAVDGLRQPGSAFKLFTLVAALESGEYGPGSLIDSHPLDIPQPQALGGGRFIVHNVGNVYSGPITLAQATAVSDNTVFAQVGVHVGTQRIAQQAHLLGIRTPVSENYAMIIGGLHTGVSVLDMAHAYETIAAGGLKVYNPVLGDADQGPIGIQSITCAKSCPFRRLVNHPVRRRVVPGSVAQTITSLLHGPVSPGGTAPGAAIPGVPVAGKTGTTSNYVDAWFVGWTPQMTTAVWVGYPQGAIPMNTQYNGGPVEGGTFPALIWHDFMVQALQILAQEQAAHGKPAGAITTSTTASPANPTGTSASKTTSATATPAPTNKPATTGGGVATGGANGAGKGPGATTTPRGGTTGAGGGTTATGGGTTGAGGGTTATGGGTTGTTGGTTGSGAGGGSGGTGGGGIGGAAAGGGA